MKNIFEAFTQHKLLITSLIFSSLLITHLVFRSLEKGEHTRISQNLRATLRNEVAVANSYAIGKTIADFENLEIIKCARLMEVSDFTRIFYDTFDIKKCNSTINKFRTQHLTLPALNGLNYELAYVPSLNIYALSLEIFSYCLIFISSFMIVNYLQKRSNAEKIKIKLLEFEHKSLSEKASQVTHDIASPLSSIKMMTSLLNDINPEIKQILEGAIVRTQDIVDDLKRNKIQHELFSLNSCLAEIIKEKKDLFTNCQITLELDSNEPYLIMGSSSNLKRVFSNLLNNSFESFNEKHGKIQIKLSMSNSNCNISISDNGPGIPDEILEKLGTKGITYGKLNHASAGSGLGVYNAFLIIQNMNGTLKFDSQKNRGTTVHIEIPTIELT